mmetsp:Transcript_15109/g.28408  ORF Transcript_15109/g.28408 Transcript_15109/m.28408 type:complete len:331 (-) Transcript_15109:78-1070(-)
MFSWLQLCTLGQPCARRALGQELSCDKGLPDQGQIQHIFGANEGNQFLQTMVARAAQASSKARIRNSLEATSEPPAGMPLRWMHIPKCGSSLVNTLIHLPGVCPGIDSDYRVDRQHLGTRFMYQFLHDCPRICDASRFICDVWSNSHSGLGSTYNALRSTTRLVTMLRDPLQRTLSAYYDRDFQHASTDLGELAQRYRGGMTCQIMRDGYMDGSEMEQVCRNLTEADALLAAAKLREGFAFVGLTEAWNLSMCLLHRMLGGDCLASDFEDTRPSMEGENRSHRYDVSELKGFTDPVDGLLYKEGRKIFFQALLKYKVSHESRLPCYEDAE